ncbi:hypothetical protein SRHO_G00189710 [Serrasalmus rhombeus]
MTVDQRTSSPQPPSSSQARLLVLFTQQDDEERPSEELQPGFSSWRRRLWEPREERRLNRDHQGDERRPSITPGWRRNRSDEEQLTISPRSPRRTEEQRAAHAL